MVRNEVVSQVLSGMSFSTLSSSDIKKLSVKEITEPKSFDTLGHPNANGLYDPSLGALDRDDMCPTCGLNNVHCPGHLGHIDLLLPVYNPLFFTTLIKILHGTCFHCKKLCKIGLDAHLLKAQIKILDNGFIDGLLKLEDMFRLVTKEQDITNEDIVSQRMAALADEIIKKGGTQDYYVKNIVDQRQKLIKEYIKTKITCSISKCHHCHMPARMLRHEHNCKIFFTKKLTKEKTSKTLMNKNLERKKLVDRITASDWQEGDEIVLDLEDGAINTTLTSEVEVFLSQTYLTPSEARNHLRKVWKTSGDVLKILFGALNERSNEQCCPVDLFFLDVLSVAPNRFRPLSFMRGEKFENPQTANLAKVVLSVMEAKFILRELKHNQPEGDKGVTADDQSKEILDKITGGTLIEKLQNIWIKMQIAVNVVIDCDLDKLSNDNQPGIRQLLEKKAGLFRKHMMGKRVDYAARSVISPDPYINVDEIGIPEVFAKKLTYPQSVTPWNIEVLRQAVVNGPNVHPGATHVANEDGKLTLLNPNNEVQRKAIANQLLKPNTSTGNFHGHKKVYRHLKNGDFLLLNRQPTLHRPSIQAHKARILPKEKTLRLHYACCKAYNADFDGDEMNAHFPQNEIARAEASQIAAVPYQFLVPKDGTPLAGLIQDHVIAGSHLSLRGRHFNRADYHQLVYSGLSHKRETVKLLPPCIQKPVRLWSGKQVISSVLLNIIPNSKPPITLHGKSKVSGKNWKGRGNIQRYGGTPLVEDDMLESEVIIRDGELLCGLLDKAHYGPTPYGLCHCCYEIYGPEMAGLLLTCLARLFTTFLQLHGFTLGVEDILVKDDANLTRHKVMKDSTACGDTVASKAFAVSPSNHDTIKEKYMAAHFAPRLKRGMLIKELDICMKSATDDFQNQISKVCMPAGLIKQFPQNNLQLMVQSGAKGSSVNCMQISCLLGQIELEGARPPLMISGRSLPSFLPQDTSPRAGGYIDGRFLTGIRPQEYFFHCMAGREGLIDTACKTSSSGYLQRCLIKHLEGITVNYDMTVRDCDGSIYQFYYGEDSLDIPAVQFSNKEQLPFLMDNFGCIVNHGLSNKISKNLDCKSADALTKEINHWKKKHPHHKKGPRKTAFLSFSQKNGHMSKDEMIKLWRSVSDDVKSKQIRKYVRCPDTVMSRCRPDRYIGAISESMSDMIKEFIGSNPNKFHPGDIKKGHLSEEQFRTMMYIQNQKSLVQPGQALGLLAAQSIGEPSTQMTLNTFHFAGRGEMNVTLGIPRLREILMVASQNLRTPAIEIPLFPSSHAEKMAEGLRKRFTKVMLSEVIENIDVYEYLCISEGKRYRKYRVRFQFLPYRLYRKKFELNPHIILDFIERKFIKCMIAEIKKKLLAASTTTTLNTAKLVQTKKSVSELPPDDDDNMSDRDEGNDDAAASKMRQKATDDRDYQDDESDSRSNHDDDESDIEDGVSIANTSEGSEFENDSESVSMSDINDTNTMRTKGIENLSDFISCYDYDAKKEEWCEITFQLSPENSKFDLTTLIEALALQTVVYETKGIKQCFLSKSTIPGEEGLIRMKIDGKNIQKMYKYAEILQLNRLYSNNIHAMAETYGIEAAGRVLVKEIRDVFAAYGIGVDYRHLSMIADYMTYEGRYRAFSRTGIDSNSSPLQKMTFETTMSFLKSAILTGMGDPLKSPSARIIAGLPVIGGTGSFELYQRLN